MAISELNVLSIQSPISRGFAVTPSDSVDLSIYTRGIYVGVTGNVKVTTVGGDTITFVGLAAGIIHPIQAKRIFSTLTTATSIVGVY